jgi:hypothetical protein
MLLIDSGRQYDGQKLELVVGLHSKCDVLTCTRFQTDSLKLKIKIAA